MTDCRNNTIFNNAFSTCGLFIADGTVGNNAVTNNTVNGKPLVFLDGASDLVLDSLTGQIILVNCTNITVKDQFIFRTTVGIQLCGSTACVLSGNNLAENHFGVYIDGRNNSIDDNDINHNAYGMILTNDGNTISWNTIGYNDMGMCLCTAATTPFPATPSHTTMPASS